MISKFWRSQGTRWALACAAAAGLYTAAVVALGFEVEGIFLEELVVDERRQDVVRMALLKPVWEQLFGTDG